jgi:hypothetical protein
MMKRKFLKKNKRRRYEIKESSYHAPSSLSAAVRVVSSSSSKATLAAAFES